MFNNTRIIKDRMIYNDVREVIQILDSQVGGRVEYSIRNHLFVVYSTNNSTTKFDIHSYDLRKCFDGLWLEECCNNLFEAGIVDDKLALIYEGNKRNLVAVSTPAGVTKRVEMNKIVCQGESNGPLIAGVQMDGIAKDMVKHYSENLYVYKNKVKIPCLEMVDDALNLRPC